MNIVYESWIAKLLPSREGPRPYYIDFPYYDRDPHLYPCPTSQPLGVDRKLDTYLPSLVELHSRPETYEERADVTVRVSADSSYHSDKGCAHCPLFHFSSPTYHVIGALLQTLTLKLSIWRKGTWGLVSWIAKDVASITY